MYTLSVHYALFALMNQLAFESLTSYLGLWKRARFLTARLLFNNDFVIEYLYVFRSAMHCKWLGYFGRIAGYPFIYRISAAWKLEMRWCYMVFFSWVVLSVCHKYWFGVKLGKTAPYSCDCQFPHMYTKMDNHPFCWYIWTDCSA